jgi:hypothetical protein
MGSWADFSRTEPVWAARHASNGRFPARAGIDARIDARMDAGIGAGRVVRPFSIAQVGAVKPLAVQPVAQ